MPTDEQGSNTASLGWAESMGGAQCAVAAVTTLAVAYGAYKGVGGGFASGSAGPAARYFFMPPCSRLIQQRVNSASAWHESTPVL